MFAEMACIAIQNHFPSKGTVTQIVTTTTNQRVSHKTANLGSVSNIDTNASEIAGFDFRMCIQFFWKQLSSLRKTVLPLRRSVVVPLSISSPPSIEL
jgi:hypothetical protein